MEEASYVCNVKRCTNPLQVFQHVCGDHWPLGILVRGMQAAEEGFSLQLGALSNRAGGLVSYEELMC